MECAIRKYLDSKTTIIDFHVMSSNCSHSIASSIAPQKDNSTILQRIRVKPVILPAELVSLEKQQSA